jgi:plastocyanin
VLLLLVVPLGLWGFGPLAGANVARPEGGTSVSIVDFDFDPVTINIAVGDTVTWTNNGTFAHTSTRTGEWDSGLLSTGNTFQVTFNSAGSFQYFCSQHPLTMIGTVNVGGGGTTPTATGTATRTATPTATSTPTRTPTATAGTPAPTEESEVWLPLTVRQGDE